MPNDYLNLEPDELRAMAEQHERAAAEIRAWGKIPQAWLDDFPRTYGSIADPMWRSLTDYYRRRHDKAERQADNHERTRDNLLTAARAMEEADHNSGAAVTNAGDFGVGPSGSGQPPVEVSPAPHVFPGAPTTTAPGPPIASQPPAAAARAGASVSPGSGAGPDRRARPDRSAPFATNSGDTFGPMVARPGGIPAPPPVGVPVVTASGTPVEPPPKQAVPGAIPVAAPSIGNTAVDAAAPGPVGPAPASEMKTPSRPARSGLAPLPLGPLSAAARPAVDRSAVQSLIVGEHPADDLALARTLLAAVLDADMEYGLEWAVAVMRTGLGPILVLTSNESRGWLPPGLFLPAEVSTPWTWDNVLGGRVRRATDSAEGMTDPTRIFAELGTLVLGRSRRITALASSTVITDQVREALGSEVEMAERVPARRCEIDFTAPGPGLVDRLVVGGSQRLRERADFIPDPEIVPACVALAQEANAAVHAVISAADAAVSEHRTQRRLVLDSAHSSNSVPASWVDEMRGTQAMLAAAQRSRRLDTSHIPLGARANSVAAEKYRDMFFERCIGELVLLLVEREPDRQTLRDMLYTYGQIVDHPLFSEGSVSAPVVAGSVADAPSSRVTPETGHHADFRSRAVVMPPVAEPWDGPLRPLTATDYEGTALGRTANG